MNFEKEFKILSEKIEKSSTELKQEPFLSSIPSLLEVLAETDGRVRDEIGWITLSKYFQSSLLPQKLRLNKPVRIYLSGMSTIDYLVPLVEP